VKKPFTLHACYIYAQSYPSDHPTVSLTQQQLDRRRNARIFLSYWTEESFASKEGNTFVIGAHVGMLFADGVGVGTEESFGTSPSTNTAIVPRSTH